MTTQGVKLLEPQYVLLTAYSGLPVFRKHLLGLGVK